MFNYAAALLVFGPASHHEGSLFHWVTMNFGVEINQAVVTFVLSLGSKLRWVKRENDFIQKSFTHKPLSLDSSCLFKQTSDSDKLLSKNYRISICWKKKTSISS